MSFRPPALPPIPEYRSEPLLAAKLNDQCGTCARRFEVYVYSGQPFVEGNKALRVLLDDHAKTEHPTTNGSDK